MRNLGPKSIQWLKEIEVESTEDIKALGTVGTYIKLKVHGFSVNLNMLWSLEGAVQNLDWREIPQKRKDQLLNQLNDMGF